MVSKAGRWSLACLVAVGTAVGPAGAAFARPASGATCRPRVVDLGTLGGPNSDISGDNRVDTFVGEADDAAGQQRAVIFRPDGSIVDLGEPDAWAADMNPRGVVVGNADTSTDHPFAFAWYRGHRFRLPVPSWAAGSYVRRINARGDAAGAVFDRHGHSHPAVWLRTVHLRVLRVPSGFTDAEALGINDHGRLVGDASAPSSGPDGIEQDAWAWSASGRNAALRPDHTGGVEQVNLVNDRGWAAGGLDFGGQFGLWAAVWRHGRVDKLGQLGPDVNFSFAYGGDEVGDYVGGGSYTPDDQFLHVFLTRIGTHRMYTLRPLSGDLADRSIAHGVLAHDGALRTVVGGASTTADGSSHATLWTCAYQQAILPSGEDSGS